MAKAEKEEPAETEREGSTDGPLLDLSDDAVKKMIKAAKKRGYVTMDELNSVLPSEEVTSEQIEDTMSMVLRQDVRLTVAGRTDAGVHATGQVAHCDLAELPSAFVERLARALPGDVRVQSARPVPDAFDARFAALRRRR